MSFITGLEKYFGAYEELLVEADQAFERAKSRYPGEIRCQEGCYDCCYVNVFFLLLVEELYLYQDYLKCNSSLRRKIDTNLSAAWAEISAWGFLAGSEYSSRHWKEHIENAADSKILCPLVIDGACALYQYRPVICRLYGAPLITEEGGAYLNCDMNPFATGKVYATIVNSYFEERTSEINDQMIEELTGLKITESNMPLIADSLKEMKLFEEIEPLFRESR